MEPLFNYDWIFSQSAATQCYALSMQQIMTILALAGRFKWLASWFSPTDAEIDADAIDALVDNLQRELMLGGSCSPGGSMIIGSILPVATQNIPSGTLLCDGTQYTKTAYPALYAALHSAYIVDSENFTVPDLRERFIVGTGTSYTMNDSGGEATHELTIEELPSHGHGYAASGSYPASPRLFHSGSYYTGYMSESAHTGENEAHNNLPPYRALVYVIVCE